MLIRLSKKNIKMFKIKLIWYWAAVSFISSEDITSISSEKIPMSNITLPEDMFLSTFELIKYWGYPVEFHQARTDDGYYLGLHRIPGGRHNSTDGNYKEKKDKPVMLLLTGLLVDTTTFVCNLPNQSLGFMLADAGYDVWMGDTRGVTHSLKHQFHSVNSSQFWDFSWDEMAKYDLPAMVDYVLQITQQSQLYYVGVSQGTLIAFSGLSENIELQKKIKKFFALAPVTRFTTEPSFITKLEAYAAPILKKILSHFGIYRYLPYNQAIEFAAEVICPLFPKMCGGFAISEGEDSRNLNTTRFPLYLMHFPSGTSIKNMQHFAQAVLSNEFKKFDYGWIGNLVHYGSLHPPAYDLRKLSVPVVLFSGSKDSRATPQDVDWTESQLVDVERIVVEGYGHKEFLIGLDAGEKVNKKIIERAT